MLSLSRRSLIVSCQPIIGGPLDRTDTVVGFALAAIAGGAQGLRIEGVERVARVKAATLVPVIGIVKRDLAGTPVRITPLASDVRALAQAGADIIAFDATDRPRPEPPSSLCNAIQSCGKAAMADVSNADEAKNAIAFGADLIATTLSGYTRGSVPDDPDLVLVRQIVGYGRPVIAEGRYHTPVQARFAIAAGAYGVVIGSAITRPEHITEWFAAAIASGAE
jgi:N-acetylmannosamine-6-phosphate 2-epimerase / N-acetylmannosamine kinase